MGFGLIILTSWRVVYITMLIVWSVALAANEISNRTEWDNVFTNATAAADNWVHVGSATGLGCGIVVFFMAGYAASCDNGSMVNRSPKWSRIKRISFDLACNISSVCIISVASIYLYVNRNDNKAGKIDGMSWATVFGGLFLGVTVLDSLFFKPTMAYLEFMSSPCVAKVIKPSRVDQTTGEFYKGMHFMQRYLQGLLPLMPYVGTLGSGDMEFAGMPVSTIVIGPDKDQEMSEKQWYQSAARDLVKHLQSKYDIDGTKSIPTTSVTNPLSRTGRPESLENTSEFVC